MELWKMMFFESKKEKENGPSYIPKYGSFEN